MDKKRLTHLVKELVGRFNVVLLGCRLEPFWHSLSDVFLELLLQVETHYAAAANNAPINMTN
jgi:hypothetical protein